MTYFKPELIELVRAAQAIRGTSDSDGNSGSDSTDKARGSFETGSDPISTTAAAYQADE